MYPFSLLLYFFRESLRVFYRTSVLFLPRRVLTRNTKKPRRIRQADFCGCAFKFEYANSFVSCGSEISSVTDPSEVNRTG